MLSQSLVKKMAEKRDADDQKWSSSLNTQFTHLKDAPLEEYFPRILDIATQMKKHGIKF